MFVCFTFFFLSFSIEPVGLFGWLLLLCCAVFGKQGERFTIKPVVLFTDDRNMRSRALTSRLPVCDTTGLSLLLGHGIDEEVELDSEAATGPP